MSKGTVLICLSGADHIRCRPALGQANLSQKNLGADHPEHCRTQDGKPKETGFFLKELGAPLIKVLEAGYDVQVELQERHPSFV